MPKQLGFDLYAMIVHYKDGTICNCYARKTDNWYYFSDKMDFRIQLADDNRTITLQQWRRTHYSSSWYESGLLDYIELMTFGEPYLQSELNPMRDDIKNNHTDIVNNYNTYVENKYVTDQWITNNYNEYNTFVTETYQNFVNSTNDNIKALRQFTTGNITALYTNTNTLYKLCNQFREDFETFVNNWNNMLLILSQLIKLTWGSAKQTTIIPKKASVGDGSAVYMQSQPSADGTVDFDRTILVTKIEDQGGQEFELSDDRQQGLYDWGIGYVGKEIPTSGSSGAGRTIEQRLSAIEDINLAGLEAQVRQNTFDIAYLMAGGS